MIKIINWSSYQSYRDRKPPWIRFHVSMLHNFEYHGMSANARALLPMLWLLASEDEDPVSGLIRYGYEKISFRLHIPKKELISGLEECQACGFIELLAIRNESVTNPYKERISTVTPEREAEAKTERETDIKAGFDIFWNEYPAFKRAKGHKGKAEQRYQTALAKISHETIIEGVRNYGKYLKSANQSNADAFRWLEGERWAEDYGFKSELTTVDTIQQQLSLARSQREQGGSS